VIHARFILLLLFPQFNTLFPDLSSINFYPATDILKRDFAFSTSDRMRYNAPLSCLLLKQNRKTVSRSPLSLFIHHLSATNASRSRSHSCPLWWWGRLCQAMILLKPGMISGAGNMTRPVVSIASRFGTTLTKSVTRKISGSTRKLQTESVTRRARPIAAKAWSVTPWKFPPGHETSAWSCAQNLSSDSVALPARGWFSLSRQTYSSLNSCCICNVVGVVSGVRNATSTSPCSNCPDRVLSGKVMMKT